MNKKKKQTDTERKEIEFGIQLRLINKKQDYIKNLLNGRYYLARCNMLAEQLQTKNIKEKIDGCLKPQEYMLAEYGLMKMQAMTSMRNAHFSKLELIKDFNLTQEDIEAIEKDYYDGKIIREEYPEEYRKKTKAEFIDSPED